MKRIILLCLAGLVLASEVIWGSGCVKTAAGKEHESESSLKMEETAFPRFFEELLEVLGENDEAALGVIENNDEGVPSADVLQREGMPNYVRSFLVEPVEYRGMTGTMEIRLNPREFFVGELAADESQGDWEGLLYLAQYYFALDADKDMAELERMTREIDERFILEYASPIHFGTNEDGTQISETKDFAEALAKQEMLYDAWNLGKTNLAEGVPMYKRVELLLKKVTEVERKALQIPEGSEYVLVISLRLIGEEDQWIVH